MPHRASISELRVYHQGWGLSICFGLPQMLHYWCVQLGFWQGTLGFTRSLPMLSLTPPTALSMIANWGSAPKITLAGRRKS